MNDDFDFVCLMIEKYIIGNKVSFADLGKMMVERGMTGPEYERWHEVTERGEKKWPEFVISAAKNLYADLE